MRFIYTGEDCVFAENGDIFEPSNGGKGYVHFYAPKLYIAVPSTMVEGSSFFQEVPEDKFKEEIDKLQSAIEELFDAIENK